MKMAYLTIWENCLQVCFHPWAFPRLLVFSHGQLAFSESKEGHTSQHSNVLVGLRRQNIRIELFWLSSLNLKDIPYNGDSCKTLDRVHVKHVLPKVAFISKTLATFAQKVGLIWLKRGFLLQLYRTQMYLLA